MIITVTIIKWETIIIMAPPKSNDNNNNINCSYNSIIILKAVMIITIIRLETIIIIIALPKIIVLSPDISFDSCIKSV